MNILSDIAQAGFNLGHSVGSQIANFIWPQPSTWAISPDAEKKLRLQYGGAYVDNLKNQITTGESPLTLIGSEVKQQVQDIVKGTTGVIINTSQWIFIAILILIIAYAVLSRK